MEQKPKTLDSLIKVATNFSEAHPTVNMVKQKHTPDVGLSQSVLKVNKNKHEEQRKKSNQSAQNRNGNQDKANERREAFQNGNAKWFF